MATRKWTDEDVRRMRALRAEGASLRQLGRQFGVSETRMWQLVHQPVDPVAQRTALTVSAYQGVLLTIRRAVDEGRRPRPEHLEQADRLQQSLPAETEVETFCSIMARR